LSGSGRIEVDDNGAMNFETGAGQHRKLMVDPAKRDEIITLLRSIVSAKPVPPPPRRRFTPEELEKLRKQREEEQKKAAKPTG
jgi:hypothetical protein